MATAKKTPSTAVAVKKPVSSAVVSIQEQLKAQVAAMAGRIAPTTGINIRITQDKKFQLHARVGVERELLGPFRDHAHPRVELLPRQCGNSRIELLLQLDVGVHELAENLGLELADIHDPMLKEGERRIIVAPTGDREDLRRTRVVLQLLRAPSRSLLGCRETLGVCVRVRKRDVFLILRQTSEVDSSHRLPRIIQEGEVDDDVRTR